jgi:hypothetical protein
MNPIDLSTCVAKLAPSARAGGAICLLLLLLGAAAVTGQFIRALRRRGLDRWLGSYVNQALRRAACGWWTRPRAEVHLLLCIADHFEPHNGGADPERARARLDNWVREYPRLFGAVLDSDGRSPRHTFFYPMEQYDLAELDALAGLCRQGFGEVEVHLHHDKDTGESLRRQLLDYKERLARRHGLLSRRRSTGEVVYAFVHGNWALDNSRPDGCWCGVNNELDVLRETGCYVDMTMPSAPSPTQTRKINSIYYVIDDPLRPKSHDTGMDVGTGPTPADGLMLIQGPLLPDWRRRKWGVLPRIENACIQSNQPPTPERVELWLRAGVRVQARPDWYFVKLHTHGGPESNQRVLLGPDMVRFHESLAERARCNRSFHFHYVTAREMYNLARAAESGWTGTVAGALDFEVVWNGGAAAGSPRPVREPAAEPVVFPAGAGAAT